ncbi:helix-turn-helix domain-containing protein [Porphyromonas gingivalis]|uniref:helix-turn-helix domain-containing protein n=2 Tax=Porphyromonas gingivalis TaxID=837 RepID=UPI00097DD42B|nr:helix-turn-helix domain-containing protein [Porphyromonas gingivalis]ATR93745.1 DNA-binding protein [Porphyromonas gingivalis]ATR96904.1 DNA-binding protein [Porphyromonas gingivalis]ATS05982.1 DNA-binding protein [Porphyromonas gingivalis]MCE8165434.1 helix-turn-helix domain-containing protein [Porphyromonas gingivalis]MCE8181567.1 helix-turn-helix domain-containing protein [Porphyromonas gingivalis]
MITEKNLKKEEQIYYDAFDVARILRIHFKTALRWGRNGKLPSFKIGNRRYFPAEGILAYKKTIW